VLLHKINDEDISMGTAGQLVIALLQSMSSDQFTRWHHHIQRRVIYVDVFDMCCFSKGYFSFQRYLSGVLFSSWFIALWTVN